MTHWNEETYVEIPFCQELSNLGWSTLTLNKHQTPADSHRETFRQVIIEPELRQALATINPFLEDDQITELINRLNSFTSFPLVEKNQELTELLISHTTVHENRKDNTNSPTVKYIDYDNIHNNRFLAIRQFKIAIPGTDKHIIPDIILFVNGIPLVVVECKYTNINEPIPEAITQISRYQDSRDAIQPEGNPLLFVYNLFSVVTIRDHAKFGTIGGKAEHYLEWKDPYPTVISSINPDGRNPDSQQILIHGMLKPDHLLDLLQTFTVFKKNDQGKNIKVVSRYQQFRAVRKIIERLKSDRTPKEKGGVVWHTQGSGKSLTMSFVIRAMKRDDELCKYKIVLITDRTNLDTQLEDSAVTAKSPLYRANSIKELKDLIQSDSSNTVMAMMQKFQERTVNNEENNLIFPVLNESDKILLLIDEAHRTQASVLGANVERAMPHCTRIAFTGTPIMKASVERSRNPKRKTTTGLFGEYIDRYTIEQSILDGSTLQIIYEGRTSKDFIRPATEGENGAITQKSIDELFEDLFKDHTPEEKEAIKQKYGTYTKVLEAQERINRISKDIVQHYRTNILPNKFKAQVVASSRLAAVRYKKAIDEAIQEEVKRVSEGDITEEERELLTLLSQIETDVIISGSANDDPIYHPYINSFKQDVQIDRFKKPLVADDPEKEDKLAFLIVVDMLITGFDAPIEQVMYMDKRLVEHNLLQAIARVNRPASGKNCGYVVDYYGIGHHLREALGAFEKEDLTGAFNDLKDEIPRMEEAYTKAKQFFTSANLKPFGDKADLDKCVEYLDDEEKHGEFVVLLKDFVRKVDTVLPDRRALPYVSPVKTLGLINARAMRDYRNKHFDLTGCGEKVRALIDDYVLSEGIDIKVPPVSITSKNFEKSLSHHTSAKTRASVMSHAIRHHISKNYNSDPEFFQKLSEKLKSLMDTHNEDWEEVIKRLNELLDEARNGRTDTAYNLDPTVEMPFFDIIRCEVFGEQEAHEKLLEQAAEMTRDIVSMIQKEVNKVDFWKKDQEIRNLRGYIKKILIDSPLNLEKSSREKITDRLVELAKVKDTDLKNSVIL